VSLGEVAAVNPTRDRLADDTPTSFLGLADLHEDGTTSIGHPRPYRDVARGYTPFRHGDILFAKITPSFQNGKIGQARIAHEYGFGSTEFHVVRATERLDSRYAMRFLRQERIRTAGERRLVGSTGQRRVPADFLERLVVPLPPLDEQRRIAAVLDRVDAIRAKRWRVLERIQDGSASIFLRIFGQGDFPKVEFGDLLGRIDSGKSPVCLDRSAQGDEWSVLKLGAVSTGVYLDSENKALKPETVPVRAYEVRPGDLLLSRKNTVDLVGMTVFVRETAPRRLLPDLIFRLVPAHSDAFDPVYIEALFRMPQQRRRIQELAGGSAASMVNISKKRLVGMPIPAPPIGLQREFADMVGHLDAIRAAAERHRSELDTLFASLQSRAFAGDLDVSKVVLPPGA
jgi:type I restriction enzyme S subunit